MPTPYQVTNNTKAEITFRLLKAIGLTDVYGIIPPPDKIAVLTDILESYGFARIAANMCHPGQRVGSHYELDGIVDGFSTYTQLDKCVVIRDNTSWIALRSLDTANVQAELDAVRELPDDVTCFEASDDYCKNWSDGIQFCAQMRKRIEKFNQLDDHAAAIVHGAGLQETSNPIYQKYNRSAHTWSLRLRSL